MHASLSPDDVLAQIDLLNCDEVTIEEITRYISKLHVVVDCAQRKVEATATQRREAEEAIEFFSFWWTEDRPFNQADLNTLYEQRYAPLARELADTYGRFALVAPDFAQSPKPFLNKKSLLS